VLDIFMAEVVLKSARVVAVIRQLETASMPEHMRMDGERKFRELASAGEELPHGRRSHGSAPFRRKHVSAGVITLQLT
jgi:hypothetical protein